MSAHDLIVSVDRVLPASPASVFRTLTDADLFSRWMGPEGSTVVVEEMTVTLGGRLAFRVTLPHGGPELRLRGFYEEIDPPRRLVHSWILDGDDTTSTVEFELEPHGTGTRLQLTHHGLTRPEDIAQNDAGWRHQLDRLEALLA